MVTDKSKLNDEIKTHKHEVEVLHEKIKNLNNEFVAEKKALTFDNEKLNRKSKQLEKEIVSFKNMLDTKTKENTSLKDIIKDKEYKMEESKKMVDELNEIFEKEKAILENEIDIKEQQLEKRIIEHENCLHSLKKLSNDLRELEKDKDDLNILLNEKENEISTLEDQNKELDNANYKLREHITTNEIEIKNVFINYITNSYKLY